MLAWVQESQQTHGMWQTGILIVCFATEAVQESQNLDMTRRVSGYRNRVFRYGAGQILGTASSNRDSPLLIWCNQSELNPALARISLWAKRSFCFLPGVSNLQALHSRITSISLIWSSVCAVDVKTSAPEAKESISSARRDEPRFGSCVKLLDTNGKTK